MRPMLATIAALLLALIALPAFAADDKDKDKKDPAPDAKKDADKKDDANTEKTIKAGNVTGKVVTVNETAKSLTLEVAYQAPNVGELQAVENAKINLARAIASGDRGGVANAQRDLAYHSARAAQGDRKTKNVDFTGTDDVKVRLTDPPPAYDEKGNIKKRTAKELKELKGDSNLPGYPAEWSDVRQGSYVKLTLVKKKEVHHTGPKPKDADPDPLGDNEPQASLIEVLAEPMPAK
jgi:hypothetical protein